jgi:ribosomal protein S17
MHRTIVIRREYLHYVPKYNRYEKRHKNLAAHVSPAFRVEEGDWVTVGQCRPLSKTVRFQSRNFSNPYAEKNIPTIALEVTGWSFPTSATTSGYTRFPLHIPLSYISP